MVGAGVVEEERDNLGWDVWTHHRLSLTAVVRAQKDRAIMTPRPLVKFGAIGFALLASTPGSTAGIALVAPAAGDIVINEYASDNNPSDNDFFELLVLQDGVDLRGLRITDNELSKSGTLNDGESVFVFGTEKYLAAVPRGTLIAVWTATAGVTTDTVVNPGARDWKMVLAPGTGVTVGVDRLGGTVNPGLSNGGDALYLYLPGPDGSSAGKDNIYLDFVSWEDDQAAAPAGLADLHLSGVADNAYYTGTTAAGNDSRRPLGPLRWCTEREHNARRAQSQTGSQRPAARCAGRHYPGQWPCCIAIRGSTRAARRAGNHAAMSAVSANRSVVTPSILTSQGLT